MTSCEFAKFHEFRENCTMVDTILSDPLTNDVHHILEEGGASDSNLLTVLDRVLARFECAVGTIHSLELASGMLTLRAQRGVPGILIEKVSKIPIGKGMAGLAAERREPVQVCNLQTDESGFAKPSARETKMEGSITVPMLVGGTLCGTLGVAKPIAYEFSKAETDLLQHTGNLIARHLDPI
jgi:signal transduction protein with GAF and PtsI domain